jgi:hypothetical protein
MNTAKRLTTWRTRLVVLGILALTIAGARQVYVASTHARDSADGSCLASLHAAIDRHTWLDPSREGTSWRGWSEDELRQVRKRLSGYGDCDSSPGAGWKRLMRVRSRKVGSVVEVQLWLTGRPGVSSPWGLQGLE